MTAQSKPQAVEVGQVWRDQDARSVGAGEFTVVAVVGPGEENLEIIGSARLSDDTLMEAIYSARAKAQLDGRTYAVVARPHRLTRIRTDRMLANSKRGYAYLGRSR